MESMAGSGYGLEEPRLGPWRPAFPPAGGTVDAQQPPASPRHRPRALLVLPTPSLLSRRRWRGGGMGRGRSPAAGFPDRSNAHQRTRGRRPWRRGDRARGCWLPCLELLAVLLAGAAGAVWGGRRRAQHGTHGRQAGCKLRNVAPTDRSARLGHACHSRSRGPAPAADRPWDASQHPAAPAAPPAPRAAAHARCWGAAEPSPQGLSTTARRAGTGAFRPRRRVAHALPSHRSPCPRLAPGLALALARARTAPTAATALIDAAGG